MTSALITDLPVSALPATAVVSDALSFNPLPSSTFSSEPVRSVPCRGKVWLVGAGPGDPDLLTVRAVKTLAACTVWLVDDLVGPGVLELAAPGTRIVRVGKRGGCKSTPQPFILRLMLRYARQGETVARVKGGDAFIFGRGGEEWAWLAERGVQVEAVAGLTAGLAIGAQMGLPITHRQVARGVALVTAHTVDETGAGSQPYWKALAQSGLTIVCYMGMSDPGRLARMLMASGFRADLPVAVVQRATCADQRHLTTTVAHMAADIETHDMGSPAVIVLGDAVSHAMAMANDVLDRAPLAEARLMTAG
ncbi:uroporphyrinogen-III C-methyltransferase [Pigmentiphaga litoralis]|uniref:uroporphyrinogen-III C-methyltransferase n=1 Tax=Pigmentiphaga litoralis TaxID=516702 RepID=A0A7Y9LMW1_9BURK|nr:uroporphyrinogen-III C-methyltransferase [Pigmentiphaga litoralis]NYE23706.1 uroporphyrin-III C-methyltransferase [Pigmentiphaga litoralis]NYE82680.1 uroporphyrin-III C-methyltransferase [Pigmentiphaga litoralis]